MREGVKNFPAMRISNLQLDTSAFNWRKIRPRPAIKGDEIVFSPLSGNEHHTTKSLSVREERELITDIISSKICDSIAARSLIRLGRVSREKGISNARRNIAVADCGSSLL